MQLARADPEPDKQATNWKLALSRSSSCTASSAKLVSSEYISALKERGTRSTTQSVP